MQNPVVPSLDEFRPIPFYFLTTTDPQAYTPKAADEAMKKMKAAGFGGAILFNKPPTGFDAARFLEEPWFEAIGNLLAAAEKQGLAIWINDGWDYPPGDAAGRIEARNPELYQRQLVRNASGEVEVVKTPWGFPAFEEPESSALFTEIVYDEYYKRFKKYFGTTIRGFFSDADNRRMNSSETKRIAGAVYFPWSRDFSALFKARFGYKIEAYLSDILDMKDIPQAADYWVLCADLYHRWFAGNCKWCHDHGIKYSFHTSDTGPLDFRSCRRTSVYSEGETLKLTSLCDYPGTDHELLALDGGTHYDRRYFTPKSVYAGNIADRRRPGFADTFYDVRAKYVSGTAELNHRERTLCEMFAATNWGATPEDLRRIACWQIMQGINFIVPHAVHHRFFGPTKFFAPPEFMQSFSVEPLRQFNDWLAKYCMIGAQGEYIPEVVVIDPTPEMFAHAGTPGRLFELFDDLNKHNCNFIVIPRDRAGEFSCPVLDPLAETLPVLPAPQVSFDGGVVATMIRTLKDGSRFVMAANVWSDAELKGNLTFDGRTVAIELAPGEIAVVGGPYEEFRSPVQPKSRTLLADSCAVEWLEENVIPCHVTALELEITEQIGSLRLQIPAGCRFDAVGLGKGKAVHCFDDDYLEYILPTVPGKYHYALPETDWETPVRLAGDFDAAVTAAGKLRDVFADYDLQIAMPEQVKFRLSVRRKNIACRSWAEQGQPFYSGAARCKIEFQGGFQNAALLLPGFAGSAELTFDGRKTGEVKVFPPFRFHLGKVNEGTHQIELLLRNTPANVMECYLAPGGLVSAPIIEEF